MCITLPHTMYSITLISYTCQHVECLRRCGVSVSLCAKQLKRWVTYAHLHRLWREFRKYHSSSRQESNNGPGMTQSELMQGQSLQLLFDGFTRCDQTAIHCQRLTHSDSIRNCRHARAVIAHWALKSCWFHRCIVSRRDEHYDSRA